MSLRRLIRLMVLFRFDGLLINKWYSMEKYINRKMAGQMLAGMLEQYANKSDVLVLALPRGGVPVAYEIAKVLNVKMDIYIVRKLGVPWEPELAMGAVAMDGTVIFNSDVLHSLDIAKNEIDLVLQQETAELKRREKAYRVDRPFPKLTTKTIILVDDGIATGATIRAAIQAIQQQKPAKIIVAVPVAARTTHDEIALLVDEIVCPLKPELFSGISAWYEDFPQLTDAEVFQQLAQH